MMNNWHGYNAWVWDGSAGYARFLRQTLHVSRHAGIVIGRASTAAVDAGGALEVPRVGLATVHLAQQQSNIVGASLKIACLPRVGA
eukprot:332401-Chlamydomonas_euryale.AAC.3